MAVIIRCRRTGANNDPCFRIVATDERSPRDGKYLEALGWYDPKKRENNFLLKLDRIEAWLAKGSKISPAVQTLVNKAKRGLTKGASKKAKAEKAAEPKKETPPAVEGKK
jgi:small subunit ribosomal protein S16